MLQLLLLLLEPAMASTNTSLIANPLMVIDACAFNASRTPNTLPLMLLMLLVPLVLLLTVC